VIVQPGGALLNARIISEFNEAIDMEEKPPSDTVLYSIMKVSNFIENNPLNQVFIKREKARLPYSVFKPHSQEAYFLKSIFAGRPPTAFFPYPAYVHKERASDRVRKY
jgi:tubulin polyglutamylase TTLL4